MFGPLRHRLGRYVENAILIDIILCSALIAIYGLLLAEHDVFEQLYLFTRAHEHYELDEIICGLLIAPLFLALFSYKRVRDLKHEIAARRDAESAMRHLALTDPLTQLPNRRYLDQELSRRSARCARDGGGLALLHVALDRFKHINGTLGHDAGDHVLIHVAEVLRSYTRSSDFAARIGDDEFVILSENDGEADELAVIAARLIEKLREPVMFEHRPCHFGASIGIGFDLDGAESGELDSNRLLINSDIALHRAKENGGGQFEFFSEGMQTEFERDKAVSDQILSGLSRCEFFPYYQPQFDARSLDIVGVEALARWRHPARGVLAPSEFIGLAERLNVMAEIDDAIFTQVIDDYDSWIADGISVPNVAVNVSMQRLQDAGFEQSLEKLSTDARQISIELTESIFFDEYLSEIDDNLNRIRKLGLDIEIDDFGTGHASIIALTKIRPQRLKIDRQLVMPLVRSARQRRLLGTIVEMAKSLDIMVIAEGVETRQHAAILADLGCDAIQGFGFAHPMAAVDLPEFVRRQTWREERAKKRPRQKRKKQTNSGAMVAQNAAG